MQIRKLCREAFTDFHKEEESLQTCLEVQRILGLADLPFVPIVADVCRPELLVKSEAVVVIEDGQPSQVQGEQADNQRAVGWLS